MSLRGAPLLYVFMETSRIARQRMLFEQVLGLPLIEIEPHLPHHRHGITKYDAGGIIVSLNLSGPGRFRPGESDALATVFSVEPVWPVRQLLAPDLGLGSRDGRLFTDAEGHHFAFRPSAGATGPGHPVVEELRLTVDDLDTSISFYRDLLDLELLESTDGSARFATGSVSLLLARAAAAADGLRPRRHAYLLVFYTADIEKTHTALLARGLRFKNPRPGYSEIGGTIRFEDPSGQRFCLYEPSAECLAWESGPKVVEIASGQAAAGRPGAAPPERRATC